MVKCVYRALTPLFGNGSEAHGIGKISGVLTKIGKLDIVLMYDVYIARLIPIIKLTLVYNETRGPEGPEALTGLLNNVKIGQG